MAQLTLTLTLTITPAKLPKALTAVTWLVTCPRLTLEVSLRSWWRSTPTLRDRFACGAVRYKWCKLRHIVTLVTWYACTLCMHVTWPEFALGQNSVTQITWRSARSATNLSIGAVMTSQRRHCLCVTASGEGITAAVIKFWKIFSKCFNAAVLIYSDDYYLILFCFCFLIWWIRFQLR